MDIEFNRISYENYYDDYIVDRKLKNGLRIRMTFQEEIINWMDSDKAYSYNIYLVIYRKRKEISNNNYECINPTHKGDMEGLLFAYNCIKEFEIFIKDKRPNNSVFIQSHWGNIRRKNIYERYLSKLGFKIKYINGKKRLVKEL